MFAIIVGIAIYLVRKRKTKKRMSVSSTGTVISLSKNTKKASLKSPNISKSKLKKSQKIIEKNETKKSSKLSDKSSVNIINKSFS